MGEEEELAWQPNPNGSGSSSSEVEWTQIDSSVNAISFGFVATAILILLFLVMALFERLLRHPPSPPLIPIHHHSQLPLKMTVYSQGVSVLMPGEDTPTFIAQPVPLPPCPPDRIEWLPSKHRLHHPSASQTANRSIHHSF